MDMKKTPFTFKILMIIGPILLIAGIVLLSVGFGNFENEGLFIGGMFLLPIGFITTSLGFTPLISKASIKANKYIIESNKNDLQDISSTSAEIHSEAITKMASSVKQGWNGEKKQKNFCSNCGSKIEDGENFCSYCGKKIEK